MNNKRHLISCALTAGLILLPLALQAQDRAISVEGRGAYSFPFGDFADHTDSELGFGGNLVLRLTPGIGVYGGWGRDSFDCTHVLCAADSRLNSSGFEGGLKLAIPSQMGALPWIKAGLIAHRVAFDGQILDFESDRRLGFQGAVGLEIPVGPVLSVSPALRLHLLDLDDDEFFDDPDVRYLSLDIGLQLHFPGN